MASPNRMWLVVVVEIRVLTTMAKRLLVCTSTQQHHVEVEK